MEGWVMRTQVGPQVAKFHFSKRVGEVVEVKKLDGWA